MAVITRPDKKIRLRGRDEKVSKIGRQQHRQHRQSTSEVDRGPVLTSRKPQSGQHRPVENLSFYSFLLVGVQFL